MTVPPASGGVPSPVRLAPHVAGGVHHWLGGQVDVLSALLDASRRAGLHGPVEWLVDITADNVRRMDTFDADWLIHRLTRPPAARSPAGARPC